MLKSVWPAGYNQQAMPLLYCEMSGLTQHRCCPQIGHALGFFALATSSLNAAGFDPKV